MRLISHVIYLLFLGPLHGIRYLVVAILQTPAKANRKHPVNTKPEESLLCCIFICARPSEIVISVQLLGLLVLPKHGGSACFMCLAVLVLSACPEKAHPPPTPQATAWKFCVSVFLPLQLTLLSYPYQHSVHTIRVKFFVFQEGDGGRDERAAHHVFSICTHADLAFCKGLSRAAKRLLWPL